MPTGSREASRTVSRLVYGYAGGIKRGSRRTAVDIALARTIDRGLAVLGGAGPCLLVSGFWRSGTTWMQESLAEALGAKTVFEPLSPMEPLRRTALMRQFPHDSEDLRQATIPGPCPDDATFWRYLGRSCTGQVATEYLLSCRRNIAESFRRGIVVKDVRLQANLVEFHRRHPIPVLHVRRHPGAVVASLIVADWHWSFARVRLADLLPRLGPALPVEEAAEIAGRYDTDRVARIAAFWAVTERLAAGTLAGQPWGAVVSYERFAAAPAQVLAEACRKLGLAWTGTPDFAQPSASVSPEVFASYAAAPAERWRRQLSRQDSDRIGRIVEAVYPGVLAGTAG